MELVFATGNENKVREANALLKGLNKFVITDLKQNGISEDIPETANTLQGNARQKANYIKENYGFDCFSEDTGLEVDALDGQPGVKSARFAGDHRNNDDNINLLLKSLKGKENRKARFRTVICLLIGEKEYLFEGIVDGEILEERQGTGGFGYDPVFKADAYDISFAEMSKEEKNKISHRGIAVKKLIDFLAQLK